MNYSRVLLTSQREHGQLTGEGGEKSCHGTESAGPPLGVVDEVDAAVVAVHDGDHQQVGAHQEVPQGEVGDEERVDLEG